MRDPARAARMIRAPSASERVRTVVGYQRIPRAGAWGSENPADCAMYPDVKEAILEVFDNRYTLKPLWIVRESQRLRDLTVRLCGVGRKAYSKYCLMCRVR